MLDDNSRADILRWHGASHAQVRELLAHTRNSFTPCEHAPVFPLADEPCVAAWEQYTREAQESGTAATLQRHLIQLRFPIGEHIADSAAYRAAVRRGVLPETGTVDGGVRLQSPGGLHVFLHATAAGRIPVIVAEERADFVVLLRALTRRNRPDPIPSSVGATIVGGYNNWSRVRALRTAWLDQHGHDSAAGWPEAFRVIAQHKEHYQDRFILLSTGPYSGVDGSVAGMECDAWLRASLRMRLEHECSHYFTRRVFQHMANSLHDEIIADFIGIIAACGSFHADWLLHFMGVESYPRIRDDGRLHNYRGTPSLSAGAFAVVAALLVRAAANLEAWHVEVPDWNKLETRARAIMALCGLALEELAADDAASRIRSCYEGMAIQSSVASKAAVAATDSAVWGKRV